ncbi:haloacid dehalogenase superfamily enzyme, subfamily IA [Desulfocapsa sulfexigens DSM 10523]|uniref:phosphoglycolate phosphatase n=1 Tax=Desulfocapsa sulfexigens (strain DSM 10523 / SB164P1) TaxID=1167006 RepID=M1P958_DESSD|nr:HAD-IA family hydrolase [Desulfocapsa sulfexigens]AGF78202.1 haloacid dehalogenase superfamily enzyme, subfamily IA [Desulfocapsa sulfexigens DSM 10523]
MKLKLVIFDCDGVMFDSKFANQTYYNHLLDHFGYPAMNEEELEFVHIHNVHESIRHIFRHYPDQNIQDVDTFRQEIGYAPFLQYMRMEDDLIQFLDTCAPRYQLAVSTNRTNTMEPILEIFKLKDYFVKVMTAENARRPKPAPDALLEILEHCNCEVDEAIYIGDSVIDREHSAGCGMRLIGFKNKKLAAEYHVNNFMEILKLPPFQQ